MADKSVGRVLTDNDVKKKAVRLVISHLKKKLTYEFVGIDHLREWIENAEKFIDENEFVISEYYALRTSLNDVIERITDENMRFKVRDSWFSMGRALDKKAPKN